MCDSINYNHYIEKVNYYKKFDNRELNYQNRIIIPFLEALFREEKEISIVDISTQYKNKESEVHTRESYANEYTPDLLIAKNWNYQNREIATIKYLSVIEIKIPDNVDISQVCEYMTPNNRRVIWTNCFIWRFFIDGKEIVPAINFKDENNSWKQDVSVWNSLNNRIKDFITTAEF